MNAKYLKPILVGSISIVVILILSLATSSPASAGSVSPFVGTWHATDLDGSELTIVIAGRPTGPFNITITDMYTSLCGGETGIYRGTGSLNPENPNILEVFTQILCVKTGQTYEYGFTSVYNPGNDTQLIDSSIILHRANLVSHACTPPPAGITAWWPGDGNADDIVSGRNGIFGGNATTGPGLVEQAFILHGDEDYIEIPYNPDDSGLDFGSGDFTIDLWVKFNDVYGEQVLMEKWIQGDSISQGWTLTKLANQALLLAMDDGIGGELDLGSRVLDIQPNTWNLFAATRQGQSVTLYMNGTAIARSEFDLLNLNSPTSLKFGRRGDERGFYLNGAIDEVEIYNGTALSQDQIFGLYLAGDAGKCKDYFLSPPHIRAHPVSDSVDIWDWPENRILQLTIDDPNTNKNPDIKLKKSSDDKYAGSVWFDLTGYDLKPADIVTVTDGFYSRTLTVSFLTINNVTVDLDIVEGYATPGVLVRLPYTPTDVLYVTSDGEGDWIARFADFGIDVLPGTTMLAEEYEIDGDLTIFEYWIPDP